MSFQISTLTDTDIVRFWSFVDRGDSRFCWPWTGGRSDKGYGRFGIGKAKVMATKVAWALANAADFPSDLFACHICDNPGCVNPAHIWPGTAADNMRDASRKGRLRGWATRSRGDSNFGHGKLCRKCGHHRTDDYRNGASAWACRPCNIAKASARDAARRAARSACA